MRRYCLILAPATLLTTYPPASTKHIVNIMSHIWAKLLGSPSITKTSLLSKNSPNSQKDSRTFITFTNWELTKKKTKTPNETKSSWPLLKNYKKHTMTKYQPFNAKSAQPKIKKNKFLTWTTKCHKSRAPSTKSSSSPQATRHQTKNWKKKSCTRSKRWEIRKGPSINWVKKRSISGTSSKISWNSI
jgi:hypothetical protein